MISYRKAMFRGMMGAGLLLSIGSTGFAQSLSSVKVVSGVGTLTASPATSCPNIVCPNATGSPADVCSAVTILGSSKNFNRFGGFKGNSTFTLCESTDTTLFTPNGNEGTACSPSSGIGILTSGTNTLTFSMAGQTCSVPGLSASGITTYNQTFVITGSTATKVSTGGGSFNLFTNASGSGSFNFAGNFQK
jgi:hypothetical protein